MCILEKNIFWIFTLNISDYVYFGKFSAPAPGPPDPAAAAVPVTYQVIELLAELKSVYTDI